MILRGRGWGRPVPDPPGRTGAGASEPGVTPAVGAADRFEPAALEEVLRDVVRPVVAGLVPYGDLEQLAVGWVPDPAQTRELLVTLSVRGEFWSSVIWQEGHPDRTRGEVATDLARDLRAWDHLTPTSR
jgi:hypothetical protein